MKLHELPAGAKFKVAETGEEVYKFFNLDGMFAYCQNKEGKILNFPAWTDVEILNTP